MEVHIRQEKTKQNILKNDQIVSQEYDFVNQYHDR